MKAKAYDLAYLVETVRYVRYNSADDFDRLKSFVESVGGGIYELEKGDKVRLKGSPLWGDRAVVHDGDYIVLRNGHLFVMNEDVFRLNYMLKRPSMGNVKGGDA